MKDNDGIMILVAIAILIAAINFGVATPTAAVTPVQSLQDFWDSIGLLGRNIAIGMVALVIFLFLIYSGKGGSK